MLGIVPILVSLPKKKVKKIKIASRKSDKFSSKQPSDASSNLALVSSDEVTIKDPSKVDVSSIVIFDFICPPILSNFSSFLGT